MMRSPVSNRSTSGNSQLWIGIAWATASYLFWGLSPFYWKCLETVPPFVLLAHRVVWSGVFSLPIALAGRHREELRSFRGAGRRQWAYLLLAALMIGSNWYCYVLAMITGRVLDSALAYLLTPLASVVLGVWWLHEPLNRYQTTAVLVASVGVGCLAWTAGHLPFLALYLAFSFAVYGAVKKRLLLNANLSVALETIFLMPWLLGYLLWHGELAYSARVWLLLLMTGPVTVVPLVWYSKALPHLRLVTLGFLLYLAPILQFVLAVFCFGEPFGKGQQMSFLLTGVALTLFTWDMIRRNRGALVPADPPA